MDILRVVHATVGYSEQETVGQSVLSFVHPDDQGLVEDAFSRLLGGVAQVTVTECRVLDPRGEWRWFEVYMTDLLEDADIGAILFNYRSIEERKKLEEVAHLLDDCRKNARPPR
jgi:PAS domain S-box-containing protein